jgi:hypothetical protein
VSDQRHQDQHDAKNKENRDKVFHASQLMKGRCSGNRMIRTPSSEEMVGRVGRTILLFPVANHENLTKPVIKEAGSVRERESCYYGRPDEPLRRNRMARHAL